MTRYLLDTNHGVKRRRRIMFNGLAVVSGVLFLAVCWLWIASVIRNDAVGWAGWRDERAGVWHGWGGDSRRHQLILFHFVGTWKMQNPAHVDGYNNKIRPGFFHERRWPAQWGIEGIKSSSGWGPLSWAGLGMRSIAMPPGIKPMGLHVITVPYWLLASAFAALPVHAAARRLRRRRREARGMGFCRHCRYDLRATPERCPECGAVPAGNIGIST